MQPAASAGPILRVAIAAGKFHGVMRTEMPIGSWSTRMWFAAAGASLVSSHVAAVLGFGAAWAAQPILWVAHAGAALPGSSRPWPVAPFALAWLAAACLATAFLLPVDGQLDARTADALLSRA